MPLKNFLLFSILLVPGFFFCQQDTALKVSRTPRACEVHLKDGSSYKGYIEKQNDSLIYLKGSSGVSITIPKDHVSEIDFLREHSQKDTVNFTHLHIIPSIGRRYYVATSNALPFRKQEIWASTSYLLLYHVNYAFNQHFSLGIVTSLIGAPMGLQAKGNFELGHRLHLGLEGVAGTMMYLNPNTYGTGGVVKLTFGDEQKNYTFFCGFMDAEYWVASRRGRRGRPPVQGNYYIRYTSPFLGAAAMLPMSPRMGFVTEVFAFPNISIYTASIALRTLGWKKLSLAFGIQVIGNTNVNVNRSFTLPYFGLSARL